MKIVIWFSPVFLLGILVPLCTDSRLLGKGFLWRSSAHISSIGIHHSSVENSSISFRFFQIWVVPKPLFLIELTVGAWHLALTDTRALRFAVAEVVWLVIPPKLLLCNISSVATHAFISSLFSSCWLIWVCNLRDKPKPLSFLISSTWDWDWLLRSIPSWAPFDPTSLPSESINGLS